MLLEEFFAQHVDEKLAPKTVERYHEQAAYLDPELLAMAHRRDHAAAPQPRVESAAEERWPSPQGPRRHVRSSAKTVRNIAGVVSSAFARAIRWGLVSTNPVTNSEPPRVKKHYGIALTPAQQELVLETAIWTLVHADLPRSMRRAGARRGEVLALRWSDIREGRATIARSLTQTKAGPGRSRGRKRRGRGVVRLPESALTALEAHRKRQDEFRRQFGPDYRADLI